MLCTDCIAAKRPPKGSKVPHYCHACGFPLTETGARIVRPEAAVLVAQGEALAAHQRGEVALHNDRAPSYLDPVKVAAETARRLRGQ